jgi:hypothetical protein
LKWERSDADEAVGMGGAGFGDVVVEIAGSVVRLLGGSPIVKKDGNCAKHQDVHAIAVTFADAFGAVP